MVHINKIEFTRTENLTPLKIVDNVSCIFTREVDFTKIDIQELVGVNIEDSYENNQKVYTTTATFTTRCKEPFYNRCLAFRLSSVDGKRYLIGTNGRPYPIIKEKNPFPEKVPDSSMKIITITWKSTFPMLLIIG